MTPTNYARDTKRAEEQKIAQYKRPRCMICSKPINYEKTGVHRRTFTCSQQCARKRWDWFQRRSRAKR